MAWGAVIGAGASLAGSLISSDSASSAADAQSQASAAAIAEQRRQYDQTRTDNADFLKNGKAGSNKLAYLLGLGDPNAPVGGFTPQTLEQFSASTTHPNSQATRDDYYGSYLPNNPATEGQVQTDPSGYGSLTRKFSASDLAADPVYNSGLQFGLDQGTQGINNQASATGSLLSGATLKALTRFGNDYGTTKAQGSYDRYTADNTNIYNKLAGISGSGQTAAAQVGASGANTANQISGIQTNLGNARGASSIAQGNALSGGLTGAYGAYQGNQLLSALKGGSNYGGTPYAPYNADVTIPMQAGGGY